MLRNGREGALNGRKGSHSVYKWPWNVGEGARTVGQGAPAGREGAQGVEVGARIAWKSLICQANPRTDESKTTKDFLKTWGCGQPSRRLRRWPMKQKLGKERGLGGRFRSKRGNRGCTSYGMEETARSDRWENCRTASPCFSKIKAPRPRTDRRPAPSSASRGGGDESGSRQRGRTLVRPSVAVAAAVILRPVRDGGVAQTAHPWMRSSFGLAHEQDHTLRRWQSSP